MFIIIMFQKLGLILRTVRHLKFVQIYSRFWFRYYKPRIDFNSAPSISSVKHNYIRINIKHQSMIGPEEWILLNQKGTLSEIGWLGDCQTKLWRYNQHYFDDLNAIGSEERIDWHTALIQKWMTNNPPGTKIGWDPYPTSLRIVNWIKWALKGNELSEDAIHSLAIQVRYLEKRLEWHLLGNHLFVNAKALIYAGLFFNGVEANKFLAKGFDILDKQFEEQILTDGSHLNYHQCIML